MAARLALFTLSAFALLVSVSADLSLKVTGPAQVDDISGLQIKATLKNTGSSPLMLVNDPRSALSTTPTNTFSISHESGANPAFTGMLVKYGLDLAAKDGAVTILNPGQSIDATHSLADAYNFTNSGPGTYEILPSTLFHAVSEGGNAQPIYASLENSHKVAISSSARLAVPRESGEHNRDTILTKRANFQACTASQQSQIYAAISAAQSYVSDAAGYLNAHTTSTPSTRFAMWFGSYTYPRRIAILNHYNSIATPPSFISWTYDCSCSEANTYAYVYPGTYGFMYLCPVFWTAPNTGTDSKAGTLVHESTHYTATASTRDFAYGQAACQSLATSNPDQAGMNADSHEYFAENNPHLA